MLWVPRMSRGATELNLCSLHLNCCVGFVWQDFGGKRGMKFRNKPKVPLWDSHWQPYRATAALPGKLALPKLGCTKFSSNVSFGIEGCMVLSGCFQLGVGLVFPTVKGVEIKGVEQVLKIKTFLFCLSPRDENREVVVRESAKAVRDKHGLTNSLLA